MPNPSEIARQEEEAAAEDSATCSICGGPCQVCGFPQTAFIKLKTRGILASMVRCPRCLFSPQDAKPEPKPSYEDLESALKAVAVLNAEQGRARLEAEASRDTIRAHAQAGLDKYRRQDAILDTLEGILFKPSSMTLSELANAVANVLRQRRGV